VLEHKDLLVEFWAYLDCPAYPRRRASDASENNEQQDVGLDSLQASYFCKTIGVLLSKYPIEVGFLFCFVLYSGNFGYSHCVLC
jgi:hypothetical protein